MYKRQWNNGGFKGIETWMGKTWWELRTCGPRPEQLPANFVAISFKDWNFRITLEFMEELSKEYTRQLAGTMHLESLNKLLAEDGLEFVDPALDSPAIEVEEPSIPLSFNKETGSITLS